MDKRSFLRVFIVTLLFSLVGCGGSLDSSSNYDIQGVAFLEDGITPAEGVNIEVLETLDSDLTNASGGFKIEDHPGLTSITLHITWRGGVDHEIELRDIPDDTTVIKLVLRFRASLNRFYLDDLDYLNNDL